MRLEETFTSFLLQHQQRHNRTLNFLILMEGILTAARYIEHYYHVAALQGNLGEAGEVNVQGESQMKMDVLSNDTVIHYLRDSKQVIEAVSEECDDPIPLDKDGRYFVYLDPLDGSSNVKHSLPVGFLFGIAKRNLDGPEDNRLRPGDEFIAAGKFLIPTGVFTFALKDAGAWRFLRSEAGVYVRPQKVMLPTSSKKWELSFNAANRHTFADGVQSWLADHERNYAFRYAGSLAVDFHRLLNNGGMFCYPAIVNHPDPKKNRPQGKLRLLYECDVAAFIAKEAGGFAVDEQGRDVLSVMPQDAHERGALYVGNRELVESIQKVLKA